MSNKLISLTCQLYFAASLLFVISGCEISKDNTNVLAEAFGNRLMVSDIPISGDFKNASDSLEYINQYIDSWIMDEILFQKAKKEIASKEDLDDLVYKYKRSIYIHALEKQELLKMDTSIATSEIDSSLSELDESLSLQEDILQVLFIKVPLAWDNDTLATLWKTEDLIGLNTYVSAVDGLAFLDIDKWYYLSEIKSIIPEKLFNKINLSKTENYSLKTEENKYQIKLLNVIKKSSEVPNPFVKEIMKLRIQHDKAKSYIAEWKLNLFKNNIEDKDIVIYNNQAQNE